MLDQAINEFLPFLLKGARVTLELTLYSFLLSSVLGLALALMKVSHWRSFIVVSMTFINILRGLPIIVILFYIYFVLPDLGLNLTAFQAGVIGLGVAYSAYQAENFRAGIQAIDHGQIEASQAIGMRAHLTMRRVVLPQAFKIVLPSYGNTLVMMLKDSSLVSTISVMEMARAGQMMASATFQNTTIFTMVAILYLLMSLPLMYLIHRLEKRSAKGMTRD